MPGKLSLAEKIDNRSESLVTRLDASIRIDLGPARQREDWSCDTHLS